jgi:hypothetical protein
MSVYFSLLFLIVLIHLLPLNNQKTYNLKLLISFLLIFIFGAIRVDFGADYYSYEKIFEGIHNQNFVNSGLTTELGFQWLCILSPSYRVLLVLLTGLMSISYFFLFKKYVQRKYAIFAFILLFICTYSLIGQLTGIRNAIVINILMLSIPFLVNRKIIPFFLIIITGAFFHTSSLLMLPLYFIITPGILSIRKSIGVFLFLIIFTIFIRSEYGIKIMMGITLLFFDRYEIYVMNENINSEFSLGLILYWILIFIFIIITLFILTKLKLKEENNERVILKLSLCFWVVFLIGSFGLSSRLYFFFAPFLIVASTIIAKKLISNTLRYSYLFLLLFYFSFYFFNDWIQNENFDQYFREYHNILGL